MANELTTYEREQLTERFKEKLRGIGMDSPRPYNEALARLVELLLRDVEDVLGAW